MPRPPPRSPLFPYTTLFRSALGRQVVPAAGQVEPRVVDQRPELLEGHPEGLGQLVPVRRPVVGQVVGDPPPLHRRVGHRRLLPRPGRVTRRAGATRCRGPPARSPGPPPRSPRTGRPPAPATPGPSGP